MTKTQTRTTTTSTTARVMARITTTTRRRLVASPSQPTTARRTRPGSTGTGRGTMAKSTHLNLRRLWALALLDREFSLLAQKFLWKVRPLYFACV